MSVQNVFPSVTSICRNGNFFSKYFHSKQKVKADPLKSFSNKKMVNENHITALKSSWSKHKQLQGF